jgi:hypothetical protein
MIDDLAAPEVVERVLKDREVRDAIMCQAAGRIVSGVCAALKPGDEAGPNLTVTAGETNLPMFIVIEDSPAWEALCRVVRTSLPKAGRIYPIKRAEFQSLKTDLLAIGLGPKEETDNGT